jgi:hypothetical protein
VAIGLDPGLRGTFAEVAKGRVLAIGYFTSPLWGNILIGDLELHWLDGRPGGAIELPSGYVALEPIDGVGVVADERLIGVLSDAAPTLVETGPPFARGLDVRLDAAEAWIDFLDSPAARRPPPA